jgi:hypothetical protein
MGREGWQPSTLVLVVGWIVHNRSQFIFCQLLKEKTIINGYKQIYLMLDIMFNSFYLYL